MEIKGFTAKIYKKLSIIHWTVKTNIINIGFLVFTQFLYIRYGKVNTFHCELRYANDYSCKSNYSPIKKGVKINILEINYSRSIIASKRDIIA